MPVVFVVITVTVAISATLPPLPRPLCSFLTQTSHAAGVHETTATVTRWHGLDDSTHHQGDRQS